MRGPGLRVSWRRPQPPPSSNRTQRRRLPPRPSTLSGHVGGGDTNPAKEGKSARIIPLPSQEKTGYYDLTN